jgi:O-antigen biosynthesis protein
MRPSKLPDYRNHLSPWFQPLHLVVNRKLARRPFLNVLIPTLLLSKMSGGPNTILILATMLASRGVDIRVISTNTPVDPDSVALSAHLRKLSGFDILPKGLFLVDGFDRSVPIEIGANDLFMATAWWTAQIAKYSVGLTRHNKFLYMIQDCETLLHASSSDYALTLETYGLPHVPIINTQVLRDHLVATKTGQFADRGFAKAAIVFEPAIDRAFFHPMPRKARKAKNRLLFYARPLSGHRNLFQLGVAALQKLLEEKVISSANWEFLALGNEIQTMPLGRKAELVPLPWQGFSDYAQTMREADVLLSLMLSPHPSYPPLEMAACGRPAVTNTFGSKTQEVLAGLSPNIVGAEPTVESIAERLGFVMNRINASRWRGDALSCPSTWEQSLTPILPKILAAMDAIRAG